MRERMAARGRDTKMRTLFLATAAFAALMIGAPIGKAHADTFQANTGQTAEKQTFAMRIAS
jgi:hypothetical protein